MKKLFLVLFYPRLPFGSGGRLNPPKPAIFPWSRAFLCLKTPPIHSNQDLLSNFYLLFSYISYSQRFSVHLFKKYYA